MACSTALIGRPVAITRLIAFSIDLRVMILRGRICLRMALTSTSAEAAADTAFSASGEAICEEPSRLMPSASNEEDMVLAVNMPPQAPTVDGLFLDADEIVLAHLAGGVGADRLEGADDGEVLTLPICPGLMVPAYT